MKALLKTINHWKLPALALIGLIFALVTVLGRKSPPEKNPYFKPPEAQFVSNISGIGVVEPSSEVIAIGTEISGVVRTISVKVQEVVTEGKTLFTLDDRDVSAHIKVLEAGLESSKIQEEDAKAQFDMVSAIADKRAIAQDEFNRRKFAHLLAQKKRKEAEAQLIQAKTTKDRLSIKAPISGQILSVNVRPGEFAQAGVLSEPLMRIGKTDILHVRVEIDEEKASYISQNASAKGFARGITDQAIPLTFVRFEPFVRAKQNLAIAGQRVDTRVLQVIYAVDKSIGALFVGQQLDVFIDSGRRP